MSITEVCLRRPVLAWMLMLGTILIGVLAVTRIGISQFPDVDHPTVTVGVSWPGASPEDVEAGVVGPIEDALAQVSGILEITSQARRNFARVTARFDLERDIDLAVQDVQARVAQIQRQLPSGVQPPSVSKSNPDDTPILTVGVSGPYGRQLLADVARYQLRDALRMLEGVGEVQMMGYLDRAVRIWIDADRLVATGTTVSDVAAAVQRQHVTSAGGQLTDGQRAINIRVLGEAVDLETLRDLPIRKAGAAQIRLGDVALVEDGFVDITGIARANGTPVQAMAILKQPGSNAVAVARAVRAAIAEVQQALPAGMKVEVLFDATRFITESVDEMKLEIALAVGFTALVCWLFLGSLSSTLNVVLAIPMSLLGTIAVLYFLGWTLNTFTLLGLSLAVGLVVDDAVMVVENIFRHAEAGKDRARAAREGTHEIAFAALAATIAVIAIFLPVAFMSGVIGKYFLQFGVTLSVAVALSYLEAITLAPARCARMLRGAARDRGWLGRAGDRAFTALARAYGRALAAALRRPAAVLGLGVAVTLGAGWSACRLPQELVPSQDQSRLHVRLDTAAGADLAETDRLTRRAEAILAGHDEIAVVLTFVNVASATMLLTLVDPEHRGATQAELAATIRRELRQIPGVRPSVHDLSQQGFAGSPGKPIELSVRGGDWATLVALSREVRARLGGSGLAVDLDSDHDLGPPELVIAPDRPRAADVSVNVDDIATTVNALLGGAIVGQYSKDGRRMDIRLRLLQPQRTRPEDLERLRVRSATGHLVPLASVTTATEATALRQINHDNRQRAIRITANVAPGRSQGEVLDFIRALPRPPGYSLVLTGQSSQLGDARRSLQFALLVGIVIAYMVLASQFDSLLHPITVLTILPLSLAGALIALRLTGETLNVFSMIGLLLLLGIVKKSSILLVDHANEVRAREALDAAEAMRRAGPVRLRPILMTAVATMMAAVPAALGLGPGAEVRGPMAHAILGGLILSTGLSLFVVPAFYVLGDRIKRRLAGR